MPESSELENEVKILEINKKSIESILIGMGAKKVFEDKVRTIYFDTEDGSLGQAKQTVRIREYGSKVMIGYKKRLSRKKIKSAVENETVIKDINIAMKAMESLGYIVKLETLKNRTSYKYNSIIVDIDTYLRELRHIPTFLEIEAKSEDMIYYMARELGYLEKDCKPWSTKDIIRHYAKRAKNH
jgi:predicted adenylyl cyclase CyaB